ncbi:hypothetical protein HY374_03750 [Candidatus Berkelbacteria bacterium]|nr:hypothetical protein [Candidatus Berkelbacteria bacterium]
MKTISWGRGLRTAALFFVLALTLTGCGLKQSEDSAETDTTTEGTGTTTDPSTSTSTGTDLTTIAPASVETTLTTHLALATNAAKVWKANAELVYVSVEIPASLAQDSGNEVYVFGSPDDATNWWTYSLSQSTDKFVRAIIPKEDYLGADITPINTQYWKMNYVEAFQLAEANGGAAFRTTNPGSAATLYLSQRAPRGWLWWTAEYVAPSGEQFTLLINPNLGEVVDESGNEVAPSIDSTSTDTTSTGTSDTLTN